MKKIKRKSITGHGTEWVNSLHDSILSDKKIDKIEKKILVRKALGGNLMYT